MHIIEQYSLAMGIKIGKPLVSLSFFPIPYEKYIVIHAGSAAQPRRYDFFDEVLSCLKKDLIKYNIYVVQIGGEKEKLLSGVFDARSASKKQMQYIINNSELLISNDTCSAHFASGSQTPSVVLFGNSMPQNSKPYWSDENLCSIISPDFSEKKCSYSVEEKNKRINEINPDHVAREAAKKLGLKPHTYTSIHVGKRYSTLEMNVTPNFKLKTTESLYNFEKVDLIFNNGDNINMENALFWVKNFPVEIKTFGNFSENQRDFIIQLCQQSKLVVGITHEIQKGFLQKSLDNIKDLNLKVNFVTKMKGAELDSLRLDFFSENILAIDLEKEKKKEEKILKKAQGKNVYMKSKGLFMSDGKIYLTEWHKNAKIVSKLNKDGYCLLKGEEDLSGELDNLILKTKD